MTPQTSNDPNPTIQSYMTTIAVVTYSSYKAAKIAKNITFTKRHIIIFTLFDEFWKGNLLYG